MRSLLVALALLIAPISAFGQGTIITPQIGAGGSARASTLFSITPAQEFTWNAWAYQKLADNATLDPNSATVVTTLRNGMLAASATLYWFADIPIYIVGPNVPTVRVISGGVNSDGTISRSAGEVDLQPAFNAVPVPYGGSFTPQGGTDHTAIIYRPSTHEVWEGWLWVLTGRTTTDSIGRRVPEWSITWGGHESDIRTNPGFWSTLQPSGANQGQSASGIAALTFTITINDIKRQAINHAVCLTIPIQTNSVAWHAPAQRTDGPSTGIQYPQDGDIFRLPPTINLNNYPATTWDGVSPKSLWRLWAEATRDYGMNICDTGATSVAIGEKGDTPQYATNPYQTDPTVFASAGFAWPGGDPFHNITDYPWDQLQLLLANPPRQ